MSWVGESDKFVVAFYAELRSYADDERQALMRKLTKVPVKYGNSLIEVVKKEASDGRKKVVIGALGTLWAIGFLGYIAIILRSIFMVCLALLVVYLLGDSLFGGLHKIRLAIEIRAYLQGVGYKNTYLLRIMLAL